MPRVIMQEFAHSAGLDDRQNPPAEDSGGSLMYFDLNNHTDLHTTVSPDAAQNLQQIHQRNRRVVVSGKHKREIAL